MMCESKGTPREFWTDVAWRHQLDGADMSLPVYEVHDCCEGEFKAIAKGGKRSVLIGKSIGGFDFALGAVLDDGRYERKNPMGVKLRSPAGDVMFWDVDEFLSNEAGLVLKLGLRLA